MKVFSQNYSNFGEYHSRFRPWRFPSSSMWRSHVKVSSSLLHKIGSRNSNCGWVKGRNLLHSSIVTFFLCRRPYPHFLSTSQQFSFLGLSTLLAMADMVQFSAEYLEMRFNGRGVLFYGCGIEPYDHSIETIFFIYLSCVRGVLLFLSYSVGVFL